MRHRACNGDHYPVPLLGDGHVIGEKLMSETKGERRERKRQKRRFAPIRHAPPLHEKKIVQKVRVFVDGKEIK